MNSPTTRTLEFFRKLGFVVAIVEKFNQHVGKFGIRQDLYGFADLIMFKPSAPDTVLVQCTSGQNHSSRSIKIKLNETARLWVQSQYRNIMVVSWSKKVPRDKDGKILKTLAGKNQKAIWSPRCEVITESSFGDAG